MNFSNLVRVNNTDNTTLQRYIYRTSSDTTYVWVEFGGKTLNLTTMPKRYAKGEYILASYSVVVQMNKGVSTIWTPFLYNTLVVSDIPIILKCCQ
jgi:hypothetical protein